MNNNTDIDQFEQEYLYEHHRFVVDPGQHPLRMDKYLLSKTSNISRTRIQNAAKSNCILVNESPVKNNYKVRPNDVITIVLPHPPDDKEILPEDIPLNIVFEDEDIILINKSAGMVVHPAVGNRNGTLVNALLYHFQGQNQGMNQESRAGLAHRIDKDTSGLLVVAKNDYALSFLAKQFFDHSIERTYIALIWGIPKTNEGTIELNIIRDPKDRKKMKAVKEDSGRHAITHYRVLENYTYTSLIECRLETGRTHQIRAHFSAIGHPLFGDAVYGGDQLVKGQSFSKYKQFVENSLQIIKRQALHAKSLGFIHPKSLKFMYFDSELPDDLNQVIERWKHYS